MLKHIIAIVLLTVNVQFSPCVAGLVKDESDVSVSSIFEVFGYTPVYVDSVLASCERFAKPDYNLQVLYLMPELKSLLQNITCEIKTISVTENRSATDEIKIIVNELKTQELEQNVAINELNVAINELNVAINELNVAIKSIIENEASFRNDLLIIRESVEHVNISSNNFSSIILNEIKNIIHAELNSLKEETKTNFEELKTLIPDAKNISSEIISSNKIQHCDKAFVPDGVTTVYPYKENVSKPFLVFCDQITDGGGWMVIQNRDSEVIRQDFNRSWSEYDEGFGDVKGEFWLGLDNIHALTKIAPMELRIDLEDYDGVKKWAKYDSFKIGDASTKYVLTLGEYSGDAGDSLSKHNEMKFSTYDQDNDKRSINCALSTRGGWWFNDCLDSNLNGYQHVGNTSDADGIVWYHFRYSHDYSLKKASMKIRAKSSN